MIEKLQMLSTPSEAAGAMDVKVISLTGRSGGTLKGKTDILINVSEDVIF